MPLRRIQIGQVWRKNDTGETYLVTKLYTEALATYALLDRKSTRLNSSHIQKSRMPSSA